MNNTTTAIELIDNLICNALEGGSNYWYMIEDHNKGETTADYLSEVPLTENGYLMITDEYKQLDAPFKLNRETLLKGLDIMETKYKHHFNDAVNGDDDACTADVFLQCAVFGELVYG